MFLIPVVALCFLSGCSGLRHMGMDSLVHQQPSMNVYVGADSVFQQMKEKDQRVHDYNQKLEKEIVRLHRQAEYKGKDVLAVPVYQEMLKAHKMEERAMRVLHAEEEKYIEDKTQDLVNQIKLILRTMEQQRQRSEE